MTPPTLETVTEMDGLRAAWDRVKRKAAAGGADGVSVADFDRDSETRLQKLQMEIRTGAYAPEPLRHARMPKPGKEDWRDLGLPSVRDKVVQTALSDVLSRFYDPLFSNCSYGR